MKSWDKINIAMIEKAATSRLSLRSVFTGKLMSFTSNNEAEIQVSGFANANQSTNVLSYDPIPNHTQIISYKSWNQNSSFSIFFSRDKIPSPEQMIHDILQDIRQRNQ